jgi:hypothetical protein
MGEGLPTAFGDAIDGLRRAQHELLFNCNLASLSQPGQLSTKVAFRGLSLGPQPCELSLFHAAQERKQGQPQPARTTESSSGRSGMEWNSPFAPLRVGDHRLHDYQREFHDFLFSPVLGDPARGSQSPDSSVWG